MHLTHNTTVVSAIENTIRKMEVLLDDQGLLSTTRIINSRYYTMRQVIDDNLPIHKFTSLLDSMAQIDDELWIKVCETMTMNESEEEHEDIDMDFQTAKALREGLMVLRHTQI